jgi:hypothetical protein
MLAVFTHGFAPYWVGFTLLYNGVLRLVPLPCIQAARPEQTLTGTLTETLTKT